MSNTFTIPIGSASTGAGKKSAIPDGIYSAVCIGVADAGIKETTYEGKERKSQNVVIVWAVNAVNGWGDQAVVTDWRRLGSHEKSGWVKDFTVPAKLSIKSLSELLGKTVRVAVTEDENGYPKIANYLPAKGNMAIPADSYLPTWLYSKGYPVITAEGVNAVARPKKGDVAPTGDTPAIVATEGGELPF